MDIALDVDLPVESEPSVLHARGVAALRIGRFKFGRLPKHPQARGSLHDSSSSSSDTDESDSLAQAVRIRPMKRQREMHGSDLYGLTQTGTCAAASGTSSPTIRAQLTSWRALPRELVDSRVPRQLQKHVPLGSGITMAQFHSGTYACTNCPGFQPTLLHAVQ